MKKSFVFLCSVLVFAGTFSSPHFSLAATVPPPVPVPASVPGAASVSAPTPAPVSLKPRAATASTVMGDHGPARAIDGVVSPESRWTSVHTTQPSWLELNLGARHTLVSGRRPGGGLPHRGANGRHERRLAHRGTARHGSLPRARAGGARRAGWGPRTRRPGGPPR